ncbi:MAG: cadherin-like domain-containing protein, partial [Anaerolineales bacterium]|nr:cadherin-like domain-containing protein [Anaerolineales bacterium]
QTAILYASDAQDGDHFGYSVSIDGGTIAIGAPGANYDLFPGAGAVYLFAFTPTRAPADWGQVGTLNADPGAGANEAFGSSVDLDGDNLAVGAPGAAVGPLSGAGEVYMFANNGTRATNDWGQVGTLSAEPGAGQGDAFGSDVDLDGGSLVVGAPYEDGPLDLVPDAGAAYVFESTSLLNGRTPTDWGQVGTLSAGPGAGAGDCFGSSVASSGGTMIVGAPNEDGGVGDPITDTGVAYVFMTAPLQHSPDSFGVEQILRATEAQIGDQFGSLIALQGATVAIGAPYEDGGPGDPITNTGAAYIFNLVLPNLPPQAVDDEYELSSDSSNNVLDVLSNDSDSNLDPLVVTAVGAPAHGAAQDNDLNVLYTPDPGYGGTDTFTYTITDGNGGYNTAQVTVIIPAAPIADDLSFSMPEDSSHTGLLTASDPDSAVLTFTLQTAPLHGTALIEANGVFTYTPASEYSGVDGFTFIVSDGALTDTGQVTITVTSVAYATALDLLAQPSPSGVGQVVTFTATVSAAIGNPAGTLVFREGATTLLTTTLDADGAAVFTTHTLPWGDHPITAEYLGAVDFLPSSSTLTHTVAYMADLQVSMIPMLIPMGMQYTIEVHNPGFNDAGGTRVQADISDALTDVQWQCSASDGATCTPGGVGDIDDILVNLPAGSTVTYTVTAHREIWHSVNATIIITPPLGFIDPDPVNNQVIYTGLFTYRLPMLIRSE